jgi:hypothetical protein
MQLSTTPPQPAHELGSSGMFEYLRDVVKARLNYSGASFGAKVLLDWGEEGGSSDRRHHSRAEQHYRQERYSGRPGHPCRRQRFRTGLDGSAAMVGRIRSRTRRPTA